MPPEIELTNWVQITSYAICEALEDAEIEYSHDFAHDNMGFIGIKPEQNLLSIRIVITAKNVTDTTGGIQLSVNNKNSSLLYDFNSSTDLSDPKYDPTECCSAIVDSIKFFNKAQDAIFGLIKKSKSILWHFDHNFNGDIDHWLNITGDMSDEMAKEIILESRRKIEDDARHSMHECECFGINKIPLSKFDVLIKFIEFAPGTRKFVFDGKIL
jgi:hypothetical protein